MFNSWKGKQQGGRKDDGKKAGGRTGGTGGTGGGAEKSGIKGQNCSTCGTPFLCANLGEDKKGLGCSECGLTRKP